MYIDEGFIFIFCEIIVVVVCYYDNEINFWLGRLVLICNGFDWVDWVDWFD